MTIPQEFFIERQGKKFCLYAGLLGLAHESGLTAITTELIQIPSDANHRTAICKATVTLRNGDSIRLFEGYGDADPKNVAPAMQSCLLRMAETRAKSRALRDAVNIGVAAIEELGTDGNEFSKENYSYASSRQGRNRIPSSGADLSQQTEPDPSSDPLAAQWIAGVNAKKWQPRDMREATSGAIFTPAQFAGLSADVREKIAIIMDQFETGVA